MALLSLHRVPRGLGQRPNHRNVAILGRQRVAAAVPPRQHKLRAAALLSGSTSSSKETEGVVIPLNHAQLLGLQDVQLPLEPAVEAAYDELINKHLEDGYSQLARLGKEKLLFAARDRLRGVKGRTALLSPSVQVEPLLLPGAMALLHQIKQYDLVIQLSEEGAALSTREIRSSSRDTLIDFERDMALATALAQCGLAYRALKENQTAVACARLEEALKLLLDASASDGSSMGNGLLSNPSHQNGSPPPPGTAQHAQQAAQLHPPLAPALQAEIRGALAQYHPDAAAEYLQVPLDLADSELRQREVAALRQWVSAPAGAAASATAKEDQSPVLTPQYMARVLPRLTTSELSGLYDWEKLAAGGNSQRCPWYYPGLLKRAALAHLLAGFAERRPLLIRIAHKLFSTIKKEEDVTLSLAMCELLLGNAGGALHLLEDDEREQLELEAAAAAAGLPPPQAPSATTPSGKGNYFASKTAAAGPEGRHVVMKYIREHSPQGQLDLRPGLCQFGSWWLEVVAYPEFQDTALGTRPRPDLASYFDDAGVQAYLASQDGKPTGGMLGMLSNAHNALMARLARLGGEEGAAAAAASNAAAGGSSSLMASSSSSEGDVGSQRGVLPAKLPAGSTLQWLAGVAALTAALGVAASMRSSGGSRPGVVTPEAEVAAADIGLPAAALRQLFPPPQQQQQAQQQEQVLIPAINKSAATKMVQQWLKIKAEAMGPRHLTDRLEEVLEEPMLSAVATEAAEAAESGWFWNIRPLKSKVDRIDASTYSPTDGSGYVVVLATIDESADLWASNGKQGDSYRTTYQVEYAMVPNAEGEWRIASALVLGK